MGIWMFVGIPALIYILVRDVWNLLWILQQYDGCKVSFQQSNDEEDEGLSEEKQMDVFNDLRVSCIKMYCEIKQNALTNSTENGSEEHQDVKPVKIDNNHDVLGMFEEDEAEMDYDAGIFSVKITAI